MEKDETTPKEGTDLELEEGTEPEGEEPESKNDPLDEIEDVEELRKRAKGYRTERNRLKNKPEEKPKEPETEEPKGDFLSRKDFYKSNERKAILSLTRAVDSDSDEVKEQKSFIADNWEQIRSLYTPRSGKDTPEDIAEDIQDAVTLYKVKNPPKEDGKSEELSSTTGGGTPSSTPKGEKERKEPPRFKLPVQPDNWYEPKKEDKKEE